MSCCSPANYLRLDVASPSEVTTHRNNQPTATASHTHEPIFGAPIQVCNALATQDSSASTMCVLSQDNESKRVFERLYEKGVTQVKKRLEEREEKRVKENEVS